MNVTSQLVKGSQTGELASELELKVETVDIEEPEPVPVDPSGGTRATNDTGKNDITTSKQVKPFSSEMYILYTNYRPQKGL